MTYLFKKMKKIIVFIISLLLIGNLHAQSEEELDAMMDEMDDETEFVFTGEGEIYNKVDNAPKPLMSMTSFYGKVNDYVKENYPDGVNEYGRVYVDFVVEIDGTLTNFRVVEGISESINKITIDAVKSCGNWEPGVNGIVKVRSFHSQPIMIKEDLIK